MRIDMHAHYVPPRILEVLERDARRTECRYNTLRAVDGAYTLGLG